MHTDIRELSIPNLTPIAAYRALRGTGDGALIEAAASAAESRRAFIALDPIETLALDGSRAMLERIRQTLAYYRERCEGLDPDYGLVGTFAYDAAPAMQGIAASPQRERCFPDALMFVPGTWLSMDCRSGRMRLSGVCASGEQQAVARRLDRYVERLERAAGTPVSPTPLPAGVPPGGASFSRAQFVDTVGKAKRAILDGEVYQIVLSVRFTAEHSYDAVQTYEALNARNPSPYAYLIERGGCALVGASPEFLVRLRGDRAELRPLAGSRPRGSTPELDEHYAAELTNDVKERCEHAMLVDLGRNDLARVCRFGSVQVERSFQIERYSHVMHLASTVSGRLAPGNDAFDLFAATFPAGTVTGAPKRRAMELIGALEPAARDAYAGSVVHARFDGTFDAALTLRSIVLTPERAIWQAGAGIVSRSDAEAEYAEVRAKSAIARSVLGVA
jgi:anthranilate synthase component 1